MSEPKPVYNNGSVSTLRNSVAKLGNGDGVYGYILVVMDSMQTKVEMHGDNGAIAWMFLAAQARGSDFVLGKIKPNQPAFTHNGPPEVN